MYGNFVHATNDAIHYTKPPTKFLTKVSFLHVYAELAEVRRGESLPPEVGGAEVDRPRDSSPHFTVESPPEGLSPSHHERVFRDDLSPVTELPATGKRKIAINIGASPSGFILEEDEEEEEEEIDEELEVVDARMFRPIVEPQLSGDQPTDVEPDEEQEHVPDLGGEGISVTLFCLLAYSGF